MDIRVLSKTALKYLAAYVALLAAFVGAMTLVSALPNERIQRNIINSVIDMDEEDIRNVMFGVPQSTLDGFTDRVMAEVQFKIDPSSPFESAIVIHRDSVHDFASLHNILRAMDGHPFEGNYARYWHGYTVWLRPMLVFMTYTQTRIPMNIIFYGLVTAVLALLYWRTRKWQALLPPIFALMAAFFLVIPMSWQYFSVYLIALGMSVFILARFKSEAFVGKLPLVMFVTGALTSFMDLLTVPLVTMAFPLFIALMVIYCHKYADFYKLRGVAFLVLRMCVAWGVGYVALWASKWVMADVFFSLGIIGEFLTKSTELTYADPTLTTVGRIVLRLPMSAFTHTFGQLSWPVFIASLAAIAFVVWQAVKRKDVGLWAMLAVGLVPAVWYWVIFIHSWVHMYMVFRNVSIFIMAVSCAALCAFWNMDEKRRRKMRR